MFANMEHEFGTRRHRWCSQVHKREVCTAYAVAMIIYNKYVVLIDYLDELIACFSTFDLVVVRETNQAWKRLRAIFVFFF